MNAQQIPMRLTANLHQDRATGPEQILYNYNRSGNLWTF